MGSARRNSLTLAVACAVIATAGTVAAVNAPGASATVTAQTGAAGALAITNALATPSVTVTGASFASTTSGTPNGTSTSTLGEFPTDGGDFGILTTGNIGSVPNAGTFADTSNNGGNVRGNTDDDVSILKADITVPAGANCLGFDFKFLSEEYPYYVGQIYDDAFVAELDISTWTTSGSAITAPNNFAFDGSHDVVSINSTGLGGMTSAAGAGTAFDGTPGGNPPHPAGGATGLLERVHAGDGGRALGVLLDLRPGRPPARLGGLPRQPARHHRREPGHRLRARSHAGRDHDHDDVHHDDHHHDDDAGHSAGRADDPVRRDGRPGGIGVVHARRARLDGHDRLRRVVHVFRRCPVVEHRDEQPDRRLRVDQRQQLHVFRRGVELRGQRARRRAARIRSRRGLRRRRSTRARTRRCAWRAFPSPRRVRHPARPRW